MIINWGDAPFKAFITVTYPIGTCTVSLGNKSFSHSGGGTHTFTVNKRGTWTITGAYGTIEETQSVNITDKNETVKVSLVYKLWLYRNGDVYTANSGGYSTFRDYKSYDGSEATNKCEFKSTHLYLYADWRTRTGFYTKNKIDLSPFKKLYVNGTSYAYICLSNGSTPSVDLGTGSGSLKAFDISGRTGSYNILFELRATGDYTRSANIYTVYLET